jgi:hypothetical protein
VGVTDNTGAAGFDNAVNFHARDSGQQDKFIGLKAPDTVTTSTTFVLPDGDGTAGQVLKTDGSANLGWVTAPTSGSTFLAADGTVSAPGFAFNSDTNLGLYRIGADNLGFAANGVKVGESSSDGAWTFGNLSSTTGNHVFLGVDANVRVNASTNHDPSFVLQENGANKWQVLNNHNTDDLETYASGSTLVQTVTQDGGHTFGASTTTGNHVFLGVDANIRINANANHDPFWVFQEGGVTKWLALNNHNTDNLEYYAGGSTLVGSTTQFGAWTLGNSSANVTHLIYNSSTSPETLNVKNFSTSTSSDDVAGIGIFKGSSTNGTGQVFIKFNNGSAGNGQINGNGSNAAAFGTYSDERLKKNIENLPHQLDNILTLRPVEFDYKAGGHQVGFIAQELQRVYPDAVSTGENGMLVVTGWDKTDARIIKAIQDLKAELDAAKAEIALLKAK